MVMADKELKQMLDNPQVRQMLDYIAQAEGTFGKGLNGYDIAFGGERISDLSRHPGKKYKFKQTDGKENITTAAGRYQILADTSKNLAKRLGLKDFGPEAQDLMALELMREKGALPDVLAGNYEQAINKLGTVWASLPSSPYAQPKKTMQEILGGSDRVPVAVVQRDGQQMIAIPEEGREQAYMETFHNRGYSDNMQAALTNALAQITTARRSLTSAQPLFDDLPTDLDDELMDLIDRA